VNLFRRISRLSFTGNSTAAIRRHRKRRRRIDYDPGADALAAIEAGLTQGQSNCLAGVTDALILERRTAIPGKTSLSAT